MENDELLRIGKQLRPYTKGWSVKLPGEPHWRLLTLIEMEALRALKRSEQEEGSSDGR